MRTTDLIEKKKQGKALSDSEIRYLIEGYTSGEIPDYQMSAYLMAVCFQRMTAEETYLFTNYMQHSGDVLDLSGIRGTKVDKHSSGGVGDKTTLILAPLIASLNVPVAKMSGRGLGHTGGTLDKLESFPGYTVGVSDEQFIRQVNDIGICVAGQTANLAPADKKIYALRDTTATVAEKSLIASSIMSKKLAAGADKIVLDVTVGDGAFMKDLDDARELAKMMVSIGKRAGRKTVAVLTNMDEPLGNAVGNILEVKEVIAALNGRGPKDLMDVVFGLGREMLKLSDLKLEETEADRAMQNAIQNGAALKKFREWIAAQGGDATLIDNPDAFPDASIKEEITAKNSGYLTKIEAEKIGHAVMTLGGGRAKKDDVINLAVGVVFAKKVGDMVNANDTICTIYASDAEKCAAAKAEIAAACQIADEKPPETPMILDVVS